MRATNGAARHRMIKRIKKRARGYHSGRHKMYRVMCEALRRGDVQAFASRKQKKRTFRGLWIKRISIACRAEGITYSRLISGLAAADIRLDRKQLSELAIHQPEAFNSVIAQAKAALVTKTQSEVGSPVEFGFRPVRSGRDDLAIIEGIGPKIAALFVAHGVDTFAKLAKADVAQLKDILHKGGAAFSLANPGTWAQQAELVVKSQWAALRKLQDELVGGVAR
jgi:large subunit ribosomal protein L20